MVNYGVTRLVHVLRNQSTAPQVPGKESPWTQATEPAMRTAASLKSGIVWLVSGCPRDAVNTLWTHIPAVTWCTRLPKECPICPLKLDGHFLQAQHLGFGQPHLIVLFTLPMKNKFLSLGFHLETYHWTSLILMEWHLKQYYSSWKPSEV